ncbi:TPA: adenylate/guanylate cyclase domain-containing protein [Legionella anisa]
MQDATEAEKRDNPKNQFKGWHPTIPILLVFVLLMGLPIAVWLDVSNLTDNIMLTQAEELNSMITDIRNYYAQNIVGRILAEPDKKTVVSDNYMNIPGAIPIPATLSMELSQVIKRSLRNISYRFISDYPFKNRQPHQFDSIEFKALEQLRAKPDQQLVYVSWKDLNNTTRLISPVIMSATCVNCHNTSPDSPKKDWKVGDVRGIQEISISTPVIKNIFSFKYLLSYFILAALIGCTFIGMQRRQAKMLVLLNKELEEGNEFLASISTKISRYLSPQVYKSIFTGQTEATIHTQRRKLTIFFSDIKDFTFITEQLQPEEITALLNEYLTEMSDIALKYGGTVDKFIGDAILVFFGSPETMGIAEDAKACLRMAVDMQQRLSELQTKWRNEGIEEPFEVRMGINTGFCNVGNFGSATRMDYTIIGAEANLAARLQYSAEPGTIVMSYETYMLVRDCAKAHPIQPITMKGISHKVVPYVFECLLES